MHGRGGRGGEKGEVEERENEEDRGNDATVKQKVSWRFAVDLDLQASPVASQRTEC